MQQYNGRRTAAQGLRCLLCDNFNDYQSLVSVPFAEMAQKFVDGTVGGNAVVMFSKTWCPYCNMAKEALKEAGLSVYTLIELDDRGVWVCV